MEHALNLAWQSVLKMTDDFFRNLPNLLIGFVLIALFVTLAKFVKNIVASLGNRAHMDATLARALGTLSSVLINIVGLLIAAVVVIPHFSMVHVVGGLGISSVAIGFAFKDILQNFFAGMLLLWQKPFGIGDQIKTKDFEGTVEDISIRSTELRTFEGELVLIPNGDIFTNPIIVSTAFGKHRVSLPLVIKDKRPVEQVRSLIADTVAQVPGVAKDPAPAAYLSEVNFEEMHFDVSFWTGAHRGDMLSTRDKVASALRQKLGSVKTDETANAPSDLKKAS